MARGDHIYVTRAGYTHHGIDVGDGTIIHFSGGPNGKADATIRRDPIELFAQGADVFVQAYRDPLGPDETVSRAISRIGESGYHLFGKNCEHFACWCATGSHRSRQVDQAAAGGQVLGVVAVGGAGSLGVIVAAGQVVGLSGPGITSGLAAVGGTTMGGLLTLGLLPGAVSAAVMCRAFRRDESALEPEQQARSASRTASVAGIAAGSIAGVALVGAVGSVAGLSAAGITSGLAGIGAAFGGGMAAGAIVVAVLPAIAAALLGYAVYRLGGPHARAWLAAPA